MNTRHLARALCLLLLTGLVSTPSFAFDDGFERERDLTRVRKKVEALRAWQLAEELDLDEETSSKLFPAMKIADQERWQIEASNRELIREMSRALENRRPDAQKIDRILDELTANRRELMQVEERHIQRVRQILSPADTARYLMFQVRFQREIRQKAAEALRDRRQFGERSDRLNRDGVDRTDSDSVRDGDGGGGTGSGGSGSGSGGSDRGKR